MKNTLTILLALTCFVATAQVQTPQSSPAGSVTTVVGLTDVKIDYSRPRAKGRKIFGEGADYLLPYGAIWRTGANASTKITFGDDVKIAGMPLVAGTYAMYSIPGADSWDILIYKDLKLGGDVAEYKAENEVLRFKVKPTTLSNKVETFTITCADMAPTSANIELLWDKTRIAFNVTTEIDEKVKFLLNEFCCHELYLKIHFSE